MREGAGETAGAVAIGGVVAVSLCGYAVASPPMVTSTSLLYLVPAVAVLIGFVWLGEVPLVGELLGGVVVIAGVLFLSLGDRILACVRRAGVGALADARPAH